jgi:hypothetical protein
MENITIPLDLVVKYDLSVNEYLILYNVANKNVLSGLLDDSMNSLISLEKKGFIKISDGKVYLRNRSNVFFTVDEDLFREWLNTYPTMVARAHGGKRALSPAGADTILGKQLRAKWVRIFKKDTDKQRSAIRVLELQVKDMKKSGDLEYMVEATRWLNQGYHEKYSYLLDNDTGTNQYENEDYM